MIVFELNKCMSMNFVKRRSEPEDVVFTPSGISFFESHHSSKFHMDMGSWPFSKLCHVAVGKGFLELPKQRISIKMHDLIYLPTGEMHRFVDLPKNPLALVGICWNKNAGDNNLILKDLEESFSKVFPALCPVFIDRNYQRTRILTYFKTILHEYRADTPEKAASVHAAFSNLLVALIRYCRQSNLRSNQKKIDQDLGDILAYMDINFQKNIQINDLAKLCNVTSRRFGTIFKKRTGKTPIEYLTDIRINYAKERLRQSGNITYAAYETGFSDISYFYRVFKKKVGKTPKRFLEEYE